VAERARALGIPLAQPERINDDRARALIAGAGEVDGADQSATTDGVAHAGERARAGAPGQTVVVCAFGALITEPLLSEHELINVHPSLLPRWRGAAPVERAIMAGDTETGVSIMRLTAGLDSGPVAGAAREPIRPDDDYGTLSDRLVALSGDLLAGVLSERPPFVEQSDDGVTYAEKITADDRTLDPARPASELERVVRALHPHIGARVTLADGTMLGVHRARLAGDGANASATAEGAGVEATDGRLVLRCNPGALELLEVQPPSGRAMDAAAYLRGHPAPGRR
jgi:methionyl-tRNA formyltransferase